MPKTTAQRIIFTILLVFGMVFCMTVYTIALQDGALELHTFSLAIQEMWVEYVVVFLLIFFVVSRIAPKLAFRMLDPKQNPPILITVCIQSITVLFTVPVITLFATFFHHGLTNWFPQWITTAAQCFPAAYILQIFFIGPLVRWVFGRLFPAA